ncbi:glycosyltransferase [Flavisolibacter sp. BT320]|nr:glycosyltransferase [Flavisolibacter longurius]
MEAYLNSAFQKGLVSVIIPTYNRATYLSEALQSVWEQKYRPIECIVVDDGSIDHTFSIVESFLQRRSVGFELLYIKQRNAGAPAARNAGTAASKGEFIQYLDSDDFLYTDKIAKQVNFLKENNQFDCVFGDWEKGTEETKELIRAYKSENFIQQVVTLEKPIHTLAFLMRRSLVVKTDGWDISLKRMQELDFQLNAFIKGGQFFHQPQLCGLWRYHSGNRIQNNTTVKDMLPFFQKWERILVAQQFFNQEMKEKIAAWYMWFISQSKDQVMEVLLPVLQEAVRLHPKVAFYETKRMHLLRNCIGRKWALRLWILRYRFS